MKILLVSDIHSDYSAAESVYHEEKPDFVLDCGDHAEIKNLFESVPHFYIHGNHEPSQIVFRANEMPLPNKIQPGQILTLEKDEKKLRIAGLDGNYSNNRYGVSKKGIAGLESIPEGGLDILLTHESPLLLPQNSGYLKLARKVIHEIDRIKPRFVFSGHLNDYKELQTPGRVKNIVLEDLAKGYGLLNGDNLEFERKICRFR